jgi:hypothetical protein
MQGGVQSATSVHSSLNILAHSQVQFSMQGEQLLTLG